MSLELDNRRLAMLEEMDIEVWLPLVRTQASVDAAPLKAHDAPVFIAADVHPERLTGQFNPELTVWPAMQPLPEGISGMGWQPLLQAVAACTACALCVGRRNAVFGVGDEQADWLIVGEAPDEIAEIQGEPFVGPAGKLLDNMLRAVGASRENKAFITNALKCRAPAHRNATQAEAARCEPFLRRQVALIKPRVILAMGRLAVRSLLASDEPIGKLRGRVHAYHGVPVVVTFHPEHLLGNRVEKARVWLDLCLARAAACMDPAQQ